MWLNYKGLIPSSKSIMNRCLICASYSDALKVLGYSECDDVQLMIQGLKDLTNGKELNCGSAGTVFRFLSLRASRIPGRHVIKGTPRLLSRPQQALREILSQLGIQVEYHTDSVIIEGEGWKEPAQALLVDRSQSSQFATGVIINSWNLDFPLMLQWQDGTVVSEGYWQMTLAMLRDLGLQFTTQSTHLEIPPGQLVQVNEYRAEVDASSAFAVAAIAALFGTAQFEEFPSPSLQPDAVFVEILKEMNAQIRMDGNSLVIEKSSSLKPIQYNLNSCPDLFPVLATLCSLVDGKSTLKGAPHLAYKESDRLRKSEELIKKMGRSVQVFEGGMTIFGNSKINPTTFSYDTDQDHRLAFAAALAIYAGFDIKLSHPEVVNKSFPEFWKVVGINP